MTVYFIASSDRVKIGYTDRDPRLRLAGLRTGSPEHLRLLHAIDGADRRSERALHTAFGFAKSGRGAAGREWFDRAAVEPHLAPGRDARAIIQSLDAARVESVLACAAALRVLESDREPTRECPSAKMSLMLDDAVVEEIDSFIEHAVGSVGDRHLARLRGEMLRRLIALGLEEHRRLHPRGER